jgi:hypothetical protein
MPRNQIDSEQLDPLVQAFRDQLIACLEECAAGRRGLFSDYEQLSEEIAPTLGWPEAARLRELAMSLQVILAQSEEQDALIEQFLDLCSIHGENDPGEPKLARAFLEKIRAEEA